MANHTFSLARWLYLYSTGEPTKLLLAYTDYFMVLLLCTLLVYTLL